MKIYFKTPEGKTAIGSTSKRDEVGKYVVVGRGKKRVKKWIQSAYGPFGHTIGTMAMPQDLQHAAEMLTKQPQPGIMLINTEGGYNQPFTTPKDKDAIY